MFFNNFGTNPRRIILTTLPISLTKLTLNHFLRLWTTNRPLPKSRPKIGYGLERKPWNQMERWQFHKKYQLLNGCRLLPFWSFGVANVLIVWKSFPLCTKNWKNTLQLKSLQSGWKTMKPLGNPNPLNWLISSMFWLWADGRTNMPNYTMHIGPLPIIYWTRINASLPNRRAIGRLLIFWKNDVYGFSINLLAKLQKEQPQTLKASSNPWSSWTPHRLDRHRLKS